MNEEQSHSPGCGLRCASSSRALDLNFRSYFAWTGDVLENKLGCSHLPEVSVTLMWFLKACLASVWCFVIFSLSQSSAALCTLVCCRAEPGMELFWTLYKQGVLLLHLKIQLSLIQSTGASVRALAGWSFRVKCIKGIKLCWKEESKAKKKHVQNAKLDVWGFNVYNTL